MKAAKYIMIALLAAGTTATVCADETAQREKDPERQAERYEKYGERFDKNEDGKLDTSAMYAKSAARNIRKITERTVRSVENTAKKAAKPVLAGRAAREAVAGMAAVAVNKL